MVPEAAQNAECRIESLISWLKRCQSFLPLPVATLF